MASRETLETVIRDIYDARMRGDIDAIMRHMSEDVRFSIAGCGGSSPVPCAVEGQAGLRGALDQLVSAFEFRDADVIDTLIEGEQAVVRWRVRVRSPASGQEAETELADFIRFKDDKVASYRQFADTALAARLLAS